MNEVGVEIVKTEETEKNKIKYLNINVSNSEVERKPDIVRLCADAGILEYVKPSGDVISRQAVLDALYELCDTGETLIENPWRDNPHIDVLVDAIEELPPVNPQEPKTDVLDKIRAEIEQTTSRYTISRERGAMGQVEWSDRLIKESEVLEILDEYKAESEE